MRRIAQGAVFVLGLTAIILALNAWLAAPDSAAPMKPVLLTPAAAALNNAQSAAAAGATLPSVDVAPLANVPMSPAPSEAGRAAPEHPKPHKHYARAWVAHPPTPPAPDPAPVRDDQLATAPHPALADPSALFPHDLGPLQGH